MSFFDFSCIPNTFWFFWYNWIAICIQFWLSICFLFLCFTFLATFFAFLSFFFHWLIGCS